MKGLNAVKEWACDGKVAVHVNAAIKEMGCVVGLVNEEAVKTEVVEEEEKARKTDEMEVCKTGG